MKKIGLFFALALAGALAFAAVKWYSNNKAEIKEEKKEETNQQTEALQKEKTKNKVPRIDNVRVIISGFTSPRWSPDGSKLLLTKESNQGIYFCNISHPDKIEKLNDVEGAGYGAAWSADGKEIYYKEKDAKYNTVVKSTDLKTGKTTIHPDINYSSIQSYTQTTGKGPIIQLNNKTLKVEAIDPKNGKSQIVTHEDGQFFSPILSPDKTKVIAHKGSDIIVYKADGSGLISRIGNGIATSWSPDSKYILAFLDESMDGHEIANSELYLFAADGSKSWMLTNTIDRIEMWADWNPVKNEVVFTDENTGQVLLAEIFFNE